MQRTRQEPDADKTQAASYLILYAVLAAKTGNSRKLKGTPGTKLPGKDNEPAIKSKTVGAKRSKKGAKKVQKRCE